jgi:hypothetical protein
MVPLHAVGRRIEEPEQRLTHVVGLRDKHPLRRSEDRIDPRSLRDSRQNTCWREGICGHAVERHDHPLRSANACVGIVETIVSHALSSAIVPPHELMRRTAIENSAV